MKLLSKLTPAETMLMVGSSSTTLKDLMKFTFMDLLLKRIIVIQEETRKANPRDKYYQKYTYVIAGKNLHKYKPKVHEFIYLKLFIKNPLIKITFKNLIKIGYQESNGLRKYQKGILSSKDVNHFVQTSFIQRLFGRFSLNNEGKKVKNDILTYLRPIDDNISKIINQNKVKALQILVTIGGNIFLLNNLDFKLLKKLDKQLLKEEKAKYAHLYDNEDDWWYYFDAYDDNFMFDTYFDSFDSISDSFGAEFDASACSSADGGCSNGCNSCSGCGGCGGD